jgi:transcriptional regulator with XRE-family HTH domain
MPRRCKPNGDFHFVDVHVGRKLRFRREQLGISRQRLGQAAGVVHQQVEKYEGAINRVSPGCLYRFARLLNVPIVYFFEDLARAATPSSVPLDTMVLPEQRLSAPGNDGSHQGLLRDQRPRPPPRHPSLDPVDERNVAILTIAGRQEQNLWPCPTIPQSGGRF